MLRAVLTAAACLLATGWASAQIEPATQPTQPLTWPRLMNSRLIVTRDDAAKLSGSVPATQGPWSARLSPDGVRMLYVRTETLPVKARTPTAPSAITVHRIVLRDMIESSEKRLPIPPCTTDDIIPMQMKMNVFDVMGKRIVLGAGEDPNSQGYSSYGMGDKMQGYVYDLDTETLSALGVRDLIVVPTFDRTGKGVFAHTWNRVTTGAGIHFVSLDAPGPKKLDVPGAPWTMCPTADILPIDQTPMRGRGEEGIKLVLYDVQARRVLTALPVGGGDASASIFAPQWTSDGRYLYYADVTREGASTTLVLTLSSFVYDCQEKKQVGTVPRCFALGFGPTPTTMVMYQVDKDSKKRWLVLHDLSKGTVVRLGEAGVRPLDARGKYVLYARSLTGGKEGIFKGEIAMSPADETAP